MPSSAIWSSTRFFNPAICKVLWSPTLASHFSPTRAEINASIDLTGEVAAIDGWVTTSDQIDVPPDMGAVYAGKLPGFTMHEDSALTFWADIGSLDARLILTERVTGYIIWMDGGDVPGYKMEVYPVQVRHVGPWRSDSQAARLTVGFSITTEPEMVAVPA